jgi:glutaredoxin 2
VVRVLLRRARVLLRVVVGKLTGGASPEDMDLLRYADTKLDVCFRDKSRREIHDTLRQILVHPDRIRVCPCVEDVWVRKILEFLGAQLNNESSHPK